MRRYGDISIQYRYGGSRYVSWPSAIYRDTTLTFVIRGCQHVVSIFLYLTSFLYSFKKYNLCWRCVKCLLKWTFKWTILHLQWLNMVKSYSIEQMFSTFKLPQSSQTFYCLVIFYYFYILYYLLYWKSIVIYIIKNNYIPWNCPTCTIHVNTEVFYIVNSKQYTMLDLRFLEFD